MKYLVIILSLFLTSNGLLGQNIEVVVNSYNGSLPYWGSFGHPILVLSGNNRTITIDLPKGSLPVGKESSVKFIDIKPGEYYAYYDTYQNNASKGMGKTNWAGNIKIIKDSKKIIIKTKEKKTFWGKESVVSVYVKD